MKKILAILMALVMVFAFSACGGEEVSEKQLAAKAKFEEVKPLADEVIALVEENADVLPEEITSVVNDMKGLLGQYTDVFEGGNVIDDETLDGMTAWFDQLDDWATAAKAEVEAVLGGEEAPVEGEGETVVDASFIIGVWSLFGGEVDGVALSEDEVNALLEERGGVMDFYFHDDGTALYIQGEAMLEGIYEVLPSGSVGAMFGDELAYEIVLGDMDGQIILMASPDNGATVLYFAMAEDVG